MKNKILGFIVFSVLFVIFFVFFFDSCPIANLEQGKNSQESLDTQNQLTQQNHKDPLQIADCSWSADIHYWDFTNNNPDIYGIALRYQGSEKGNFYVVCGTTGTSAVISVYLFKENKLILEEPGIYHGRAFMGQDNNLYIIEGVWGESNSCPKGYILTGYGYNHDKNVMELIKTKEYSTSEIKILNSDNFMCYNKELFDFEGENSIEPQINWGDFDWSKAK